MSSQVAGDQAIIKETTKLAIITYYLCNRLALFVVAKSKVQEVRNDIGISNEGYKYFTNSPKRDNMSERILDSYLPTNTNQLSFQISAKQAG
jgi:hypothetical protein